MAKQSNSEVKLPWHDPDPRSVLDAYSKDVNEEPILIKSQKEEKKGSSPEVLALNMILVAQNHLDTIMDSCLKVNIEVNKEQKIELYLELLSFYYFFVGHQISKYLSGDQFTLYVLKFHVELLENLPRITETAWLFGINPFTRSKKIKMLVGANCWRTGLSSHIYKGEDTYIRDKLTDKETLILERLKRILFPNELTQKDYDDDLMLQFLVKSFYSIFKILNLSLPKDLAKVFYIYGCNKIVVLASYEHIIQHIRPIWATQEPID